MKSFQTYIFELNIPYEFRIKIANVEPKGDVLDRIKRSLEAYQLESISAVKSMPIQEHVEFPQWGPCECWQFDVKVNYPVNSIQVRQVIKERALINPDWLCVRNLHEAEDTTEAESLGKDHEGDLLTDPVLNSNPESQKYAGQLRISDLLKELEKTTRKFEYAAPDKEVSKTTNDIPQGNIDPIGTKQIKIPNPTKPVKGKK